MNMYIYMYILYIYMYILYVKAIIRKSYSTDIEPEVVLFKNDESIK